MSGGEGEGGGVSGAGVDVVAVIDDDSLDLRLSKRALRRTGFAGRILTFCAAEDALEFIDAEGPAAVDLILLDIRMPRMDGFEFLEALATRCRPDAAPAIVVLLTTSLDPRDRRRADMSAMVRSYLNKPLVQAMLDELAALLAAPRAGR